MYFKMLRGVRISSSSTTETTELSALEHLKIDVSTCSRLLVIRFVINLQVMMICIICHVE